MRYGFAVLALMGATAPADAVVQAVHITGWMPISGDLEHCHYEDNGACNIQDIMGQVTFDFTVNVDNNLNPWNGSPWDMRLENDSFVYYGFDYTQVDPDHEYLILGFEPIDFLSAVPGVIKVKATGGGVGLEFGACHGCYESFSVHLGSAGIPRIQVVGLADAAPFTLPGRLGFAWRAVPEPATWAMMILGFGITGAAMRRRKKRLAA